VLADWEITVEVADEGQADATHNAYHIGQITYVRKEQRRWTPEKEVK